RRQYPLSDVRGDVIRIRRLFLVLAGALVVGGCASAATTTQSPTATTSQVPSATASQNPTASAATPTAPGPNATPTSSQTPTEVPTMAFTLSSSAFSEGGAIPRQYTCDGADQTLPLSWSSVPAGTAELALVMDDPDARGFVHWVVVGIPPTA